MVATISKILFFISIIAIEYLATTSNDVPLVRSDLDKANHLFAFFTLYILLSFGFKDLKLYIKMILLMIFGVQIEIVQSFLPNREFSYVDILADFIGMFIGIVIYKGMSYITKSVR